MLSTGLTLVRMPHLRKSRRNQKLLFLFRSSGFVKPMKTPCAGDSFVYAPSGILDEGSPCSVEWCGAQRIRFDQKSFIGLFGYLHGLNKFCKSPSRNYRPLVGLEEVIFRCAPREKAVFFLLTAQKCVARKGCFPLQTDSAIQTRPSRQILVSTCGVFLHYRNMWTSR